MLTIRPFKLLNFQYQITNEYQVYVFEQSYVDTMNSYLHKMPLLPNISLNLEL